MLSPMRLCAVLTLTTLVSACAAPVQHPESPASEHDATGEPGSGLRSEGRSARSSALHRTGGPTGATNPVQSPSSERPSGELTGAGNSSTKIASGASGQDAEADPAEPLEPEPEPEPQPAALPTGTRVLHIGDSFAGALGYELNRLLAEHQVRGFLKYEKSTYIPTWAWGKELPLLLSRYRPDLVVITLGGNELQIPEPEKRAETVQRLIGRLGDVPCVWVGIPVWEGADGTLMDVIERNVAPCLFYDSAAEIPDMARARDGIHPSKSARTRWAESVVSWLQMQVAPSVEQWRWRSDLRPR